VKNYRSLCQFLRREFSDHRMSFRRVAMGTDYGKCTLLGGRFVITIDVNLCEGGACLCLLHEMAHVVSWHADKSPSQHGPAFGRAYHQVWEAYLRYIGRSAKRKGTIRMAAARKPKASKPTTTSGLRAKALASAPQFNPKRMSQMDRLRQVDPQAATELGELIDAYAGGDAELRRAYPTARRFADFVVSLDLPVPFSNSTVRHLLTQATK
jgi:hypothetical protein